MTEDELYQPAVNLVLQERRVSAMLVQSHLMVGYSRAARLISRMEQEGIVSALDDVGKREVLT